MVNQGVFGVDAGNNTLNALYVLMQERFGVDYMHLKCWRASGRSGRFVEVPAGPTKCVICGKSIAHKRA